MQKVDNEVAIKRELENCTFVKTIMMIIIVIYHSILFWGGSWFTKNPRIEAAPLHIMANWLGTFHTYTFTLVSGYIFYYLKTEINRYRSFKGFIRNKTKRLLIPYVFAAVVWVIPISQIFLHYDIKIVLKNFLFMTAPSQLWFLIMLFEVFVIFYWFAEFFGKHTRLSAFLMCCLYLGGVLIGKFASNYFMIVKTCEFLPFFWIGYKLRQYRNPNYYMKYVCIAAEVVLLLIKIMIPQYDSIFITVINVGLSFAIKIVGSLMAFFVLQSIAQRVNWSNSKIFMFFAKGRWLFIYSISR